MLEPQCFTKLREMHRFRNMGTKYFERAAHMEVNIYPMFLPAESQIFRPFGKVQFEDQSLKKLLAIFKSSYGCQHPIYHGYGETLP